VSEQPSINDIAAQLYAMNQKLRNYASELRANDKAAWVKLEIASDRIMSDAKNALWSAFYNLDNLQRLVEELTKDDQP